MLEFPILSILIIMPAIGAALVFLARNHNVAMKYIALAATLATFVLSILLLICFDKTTPEFQFVENYPWIPDYNINYHLGIDGISVFFIILTTLLMPICILTGWEAIKKQVPLYLASFLLMESLLIGVFAALDFVLFYVFFEAVLIPMYLIIGIWGGENRVYAAFKFFLYTLIGSVLLLLALIYIYLHTGTTDIPALIQEVPKLAFDVQKWLWLAFFASFAVKVPMWPFHTWLPDAHVQAPTAGSVILAGVLLKIGGYGFLRFSLPMLPDASNYFTPLVFGLSIIAVLYTSLVALMQEDMKKLIAYSSVAHMAFVTIGIFAFRTAAIEGAIFQMISHGIISSALFLCVGVVYDRMHTKEIAKYGGLVSKMPVYAALFMIFTLAAVGLPGTSGFVGEILVLLGTYGVSKPTTILSAIGMILGAAYMLWLYKRVIFGALVNPALSGISDLNLREKSFLIPLAGLAIFLGIYPAAIMDDIHVSVHNLLQSGHFINVEMHEDAPEIITPEENEPDAD